MHERMNDFLKMSKVMLIMFRFFTHEILLNGFKSYENQEVITFYKL